MTPRGKARRHWYDLADPDCTPSDETIEWLRGVALQMIAADFLKATDRREAVFEASGLKGEADDGWLGVIMIALRKYERLKTKEPAEVAGRTPAEFVADELEWDLTKGVAPDSHKRTITRELKKLADPEARAWARDLLNSK